MFEHYLGQTVIVHRRDLPPVRGTLISAHHDVAGGVVALQVDLEDEGPSVVPWHVVTRVAHGEDWVS
jgi:hypothetical protein